MKIQLNKKFRFRALCHFLSKKLRFFAPSNLIYMYIITKWVLSETFRGWSAKIFCHKKALKGRPIPQKLRVSNTASTFSDVSFLPYYTMIIFLFPSFASPVGCCMCFVCFAAPFINSAELVYKQSFR